jgi:hypothetical protein
MRRTLFVGLAIVVALGLLAYAAHSVNLVGMITSMHTPPQH